jgi:hypothetical protein
MTLSTSAATGHQQLMLMLIAQFLAVYAIICGLTFKHFQHLTCRSRRCNKL